MSKQPHAHGWDEDQAQHPTPPVEGHVRVKCIIHTMPWTDTKALEFEEEADVPRAIADAMLKKKQVELVKGA